MFENVTIGDFAAAALGTGANAAMNGASGPALDFAYKALKNHVCLKCPDEVAALEQLPQSVARRGVVAFIMDCRSGDYKAELRTLVEILVDQLKMDGPALGIDISYLLLLENLFDKPKSKDERATRTNGARKPAKAKKAAKGVRPGQFQEDIGGVL